MGSPLDVNLVRTYRRYFNITSICPYLCIFDTLRFVSISMCIYILLYHSTYSIRNILYNSIGSYMKRKYSKSLWCAEMTFSYHRMVRWFDIVRIEFGGFIDKEEVVK